MLSLVSPAKLLVRHPKPVLLESTEPEFQEDAHHLIENLRRFSPQDLSEMMSLSEKLSILNHQRYQDFGTPAAKTEQAIFLFAGDTYGSLGATEFSKDDLLFAQNNMRILSGLYGSIRPLDEIYPYRLEMGTGLLTASANTLYKYWKNRIADAIDRDAGGEIVVNLASVEYFKSVQNHLKSKVLTLRFYEEHQNGLKMIGFFVKKARGAMMRYIIKNQIDDPEGLKDFRGENYRFRADLSSEESFVYSRKESAL